MSFDFSEFEPLVENALKCLYDRAKQDGELFVNVAEKRMDEGNPNEITFASVVMDLERRTVGRDPRSYSQTLQCCIAWLAMHIAETRRDQE